MAYIYFLIHVWLCNIYCQFLTTKINTGNLGTLIFVCNSDFRRVTPRGKIAESKVGSIFEAFDAYYQVAFQSGYAISYQPCKRDPN